MNGIFGTVGLLSTIGFFLIKMYWAKLEQESGEENKPTSQTKPPQGDSPDPSPIQAAQPPPPIIRDPAPPPKSEPKAATKPEPKKPEPKAAAKPEPKKAQPEPKKPEPKAAAKPEPKAAAKPEPKKAQPKAAAKATKKSPKPAKKPAAAPNISPDQAITPEGITCLICGKSVKLLKSHLKRSHQMEPEAYRSQFDLKADYPMTPPKKRQ
ncbi:MAG: MucR family transcriptional regulator [Magnetococcales bacterium]|nr:MucR family transcriptional regulator [Magnetococcales bacterium]